MDSDQGKLFIGGISWDTSEEKLTEYFSKYGEVLQSVIMCDKLTGRPRGFGFVAFADPSVLDRVLQDSHTIDGRMVEAKRALSREEQNTTSRTGNPNAGRNFGGGGGSNVKTKKIFVGGLPPTVSEEGFRQYFETYGHVTDVVVMYDQTTQRPRGFGFISFDTEEAVDRVLHKTFHDLNGKLVEVKRALPKDSNSGGGGGGGGGGRQMSSGGGGYPGYGANAGGYSAATGGGAGFPAGYGAGYGGYGAATNGAGYGGYGVGGYGGANAGYGGPAGSYGNPNASNAGYPGGLPGAARSPWGTQAPSGYGTAAYGANSGYGAPAVSGQTGQSPSGAAGYGNQGYGYGGYGGADGSYSNPSTYGAVGGRAGSTPNSNAGGAGDQQGAGAGYMGGGYGDVNAGYQNAGWRSDPSQAGGYGAAQTNGAPAGQVGYGGGYGGVSRQAQQ
ncbi:hypothetical protein GIB67_030240 [Kingdonia uniflora]|uniref:RRM domain-containing protein n=1 Tax=Kingdonia uniflora TaxID=39325 RepID=A0A7J7MN38_9MAGN|nr:hypothetical protein GIB67_030240 [Kingdonia uniflora]